MSKVPTAEQPFSFWLDQPADWNLKVRRLRLSGWCFAKGGEPLTAIRARLRGKTFAGQFDHERPDVVAHLCDPAAPLRCGFSVDVQVPFGKGRLELQVARADGQWQQFLARNVCGPFLVSPAERELWREREETETRNRYEFFVDRPEDWQKPVRKMYISGWCVDRTGGSIRGIRAVVGKRHFPGNPDIPRADIAQLFPQARAANRSGFALAAEIPSGDHTLGLQIQSDDGLWHQLLSEQVRGAPASAPEEDPPEDAALFEPGASIASHFEYWFDQPADWSRRTRRLQISGWCVAAFGPGITEVRAKIRGKVFHANHGVLRPDVALVFGSYSDTLRSGFSVHVIVPVGWSTLTLEARSGDGAWENFFTRRLRGPMFRFGRRRRGEAAFNYAEWVYLYDRLSGRDTGRIRKQIAAFSRQPLFSILLPAYNSNARWLRRAIGSVRQQLYPHWELCLVDDASATPQVWKLAQAAARRDPRVKLLRRTQNGHICAASNDALTLATGEFVALLDHDDELAPTALYFAALALQRSPQLRLLYSDEDKLDPQGRRCDPYFKPDWNPDLLTSQNYISHLSIYATELARKVGGFRVGFEGAQDYDLALRCTEQIAPDQIHHIPHVLYHWRTGAQSTARSAAAKPYAHEAALRAVQEHIERTAAAGRVVSHGGGYQRVIYAPPAENPLVSLIIPTRDCVALLRQCVESIRTKTDYPRFEIILIDNESREPETLAYLRSLSSAGNIEVLRAEGDFNFSKLNNRGVAHARGAFVALLNNDLEVINRDWLTEMLSQAARPGVGAVGARLWYPDGTLQHGGVILGVGGIATHAHRRLGKEERGHFSRALLTQNFSAVTAACILLRKELYQEVGGLDEVNLPVAFNDVDFCLRLRARGLRIVWTPHAELVHHESVSRGFEDTGTKQQRFMNEVAYMQKRWGHLLEADPYYNPNLSIVIDQQFTLAFPPRVAKPWKDA